MLSEKEMLWAGMNLTDLGYETNNSEFSKKLFNKGVSECVNDLFTKKYSAWLLHIPCTGTYTRTDDVKKLFARLVNSSNYLQYTGNDTNKIFSFDFSAPYTGLEGKAYIVGLTDDEIKTLKIQKDVDNFLVGLV